MKGLVGTLSFLSLVSLSVAATAQNAMLQGQSLVSALRQGGYVILVRHAAGDKSQKDAATVNLSDCTTQRNLSREGRIAAREIGQGIDALEIPVGKVLSSPYCRTMDTGRLAFGRSEAAEALRYAADNEAEKRNAASRLKPLLAEVPPAQTNTVLITHSTNILATIGATPEEGVAIIFKPGQDGKYQIVGQVGVRQWSSLMPQNASK